MRLVLLCLLGALVEVATAKTCRVQGYDGAGSWGPGNQGNKGSCFATAIDKVDKSQGGSVKAMYDNAPAGADRETNPFTYWKRGRAAFGPKGMRCIYKPLSCLKPRSVKGQTTKVDSSGRIIGMPAGSTTSLTANDGTTGWYHAWPVTHNWWPRNMPEHCFGHVGEWHSKVCGAGSSIIMRWEAGEFCTKAQGEWCDKFTDVGTCATAANRPKHGCSNYDSNGNFCSGPLCTSAENPYFTVSQPRAVVEFEKGAAACSMSYDGKQLSTDCPMGVGFRGKTGKFSKSSAGSNLEFASGGSSCTISYDGASVSTDCVLGSGFTAGSPAKLASGGKTLSFEDVASGSSCAFSFDGAELNTDCALGYGF